MNEKPIGFPDGSCKNERVLADMKAMKYLNHNTKVQKRASV